ncbi:MAG: NADPH:quinone reductase, partial [Planctomycetota bacterium]
MKAAFFNETGGPEVIQVGSIAEPVIGEKDILIGTRAVTVNPIDTYVRSGLISFDVAAPIVPGCDAAGVVEAVGAQVDSFKPGDRVWCTNQGLLGRQGTFAERIGVPQKWCHHIPDGVSFETAAANALVGITAHLGLFREAQLEPAETVFVVGGTGGVGSMVLQMARAAGATVITTARDPARAAKAVELGADHVIDYSSVDIHQQIKSLAPKGVNVYWETRRMPDFDQAIEALAPKGRMVIMAGRDSRPEFPVGPFYVKECSLHGFVMFKATAIAGKKRIARPAIFRIATGGAPSRN